MRPYTRRGLRAATASGPSPRRSITPGRNPSTRTSARSSSCSTRSRSSFDFRSAVSTVRPRCTMLRGSPTGVPGRWSVTTSAPMSAISMHAKGPGPRPANSTTRSPDNGPPRGACEPCVMRSVQADVGALHHLAPLRHLVADDLVQLLGRAAARLDVAVAEQLLHLRARNSVLHGRMDLRGDVVGHAARREHAEPRHAAEAGNLLRDGG